MLCYAMPCFGQGTSDALRATNKQFNAKFGGADPRKATMPTARHVT